jgi:hypothetical protein
MFRGQSHDESDGQGNTGIGVTYGRGGDIEHSEADVEVERNEPAIELGDGLVVYGNLIAPGYGGRKFKNIVKDLSKKEEKQNKIVEKSIDAINNMKVLTPMDIATLNSFNKMFEGASAKLKTIADEKKDLAALQSAINDTAEEFGLDADALAKGKTKVDKKSNMYKAMFGKDVPKAQGGETIKNLQDALKIDPSTPGYGKKVGPKTLEAYMNFLYDYFKNQPGYEDINKDDFFGGKDWKRTDKDASGDEIMDRFFKDGKINLIPGEAEALGLTTEGNKKTSQNTQFTPAATTPQPTTVDPVRYEEVKKLYEEAKAAGKKSAKTKEFQQKFHEYFPDFAKEVILSSPTGLTAKGKKSKYKTIDDLKKAPIKDVLDTNVDEYFGPRTEQYMARLEKAKTTPVTTAATPAATPAKATSTPEKKIIPMVPAKQNKLASLYNTIQPFLQRPIQEELDPNQLSGEMFALATNQQEPVQAQLLNPELDTAYSVSFQDRLNANQADFNALQRIVGYNPAALSALFAQKYGANDAVGAEEFRANQALRAGVYDKNRDLINAAKQQNLGILDQQYTRQAMARSNTKATTLSALSSISDKIAKNRLENRQLATYSNMFPQYGFDRNMRARNQGLTFFQIPTVGNTEPVYDKKGNIVGYGPDSADVAKTTTDETTTAITTTPVTPQKYGGITRKALRNGDILKSFKNL